MPNQIKYSFKTTYDDGAGASGTDRYEKEETFVKQYPYFKDLMTVYKNCSKIHLEVEGFEWKGTIDIERI